MAAKPTVQLTANFERNLEDLEALLIKAEAPSAFDALLDELMGTVIPNLERFPGMGRPFLERPVRSVEVANGVARLARQLAALDKWSNSIWETLVTSPASISMRGHKFRR